MSVRQIAGQVLLALGELSAVIGIWLWSASVALIVAGFFLAINGITLMGEKEEVTEKDVAA